MRIAPFLLVCLLQPGCMYRVGQNLTEGMLDEAIGEDREGGIDALGARILEQKLAAEIGHQLGSGLASGAADLSPEQRRELEQTIDGLITIASLRAGEGVRRDLSPAMRQMVRDDIVRALAEGMRTEVGPTLEDTADRVITRAIVSLRRGLDDPEMRIVLSELLRDSFYLAMREGGPNSPGVGETIESTLTTSVLDPFEHSVGGLTDVVADKVEQQARRTENTLRAIIAFLGVVLGSLMLMYAFARRQLVRERAHSREAEQELRDFDLAIGLLDEGTRVQLLGKIDEYHAMHGRKRDKPATGPDRRDDYLR